MSTPLKDIGSVKLPEYVHSYLQAKQVISNIPVVTQVARLVTERIERELRILNLANDIHHDKGFGEITRDIEGAT
jgi:hypothetical protein